MMDGNWLSHAGARLATWLIALSAVGCGEGERPREPVRETGQLVVVKLLDTGALFAEGSTTHLRIVGERGEEIVNGMRPIETLDVPLFDEAVGEGTYAVTVVERPCQGNCDFLDPPVESTRCELEVDVSASRTTRVAVVLSGAWGDPASDCSAMTGR